MIKTLGNFIKVKELTDDFVIDGLLQKYDDSSTYMFGEVVGGKAELVDTLNTAITYNEKTIISFKRVAKTPYLNCYLVAKEDIIDVMSESDYRSLISGEQLWD